MIRTRKFFTVAFTYVLLITAFLFTNNGYTRDVTIIMPENAHPRVEMGAERLSSSLQMAGYKVVVKKKNTIDNKPGCIAIGSFDDALMLKAVASWKPSWQKQPGKEGYSILSDGQNNKALVAGADASGVLYGCMELAERISNAKSLPSVLITDQPEMVLRGACIGIQKPYYLPHRTVYEYPYTPETFPWLYDKKLWIQYLDSMLANRMNSLYLWNGHPFASLVKLKEYPYAVEVDDSTFKKNEELYSFLTKEADKRGIWVIQMFYNIILSKPFAEKNGLKTQDRERPITPLIAGYTRKSIAAFVAKYPNVGLLVTLGEAMEGTGQVDIDWFTKTIIPGVQDGMKALGRKDEPPIVLRAHDTDAPEVMKAAMPLYHNLYTMAKYNGEALTTYTPRGKWAELHRTLSRIGTVQIENVHILANLEPFRYASADFIQKCVLAMHNVYEANGLHIYPEASYWDWPYSADKTTPRLLEMERDWLWYKQWARYAWNCHRDRKGEVDYWSQQIANDFGATQAAGKKILDAYEETGEIAPKLLRRFGITDGNRQTLTLGMLMTQLINPFRYGLFTMLYESEAPEGEMLTEYAANEWKGEKHIGETPVQIINEVKAHGLKAVLAIEEAAPFIKNNKAEFERVKNDIYCYQFLAMTYAEKAAAALDVLRYKYSNDIADLEKAVPHLKASVAAYHLLTAYTKNSYLYANSMQTKQRKIPFRGVDATYITWEEVMPHFDEELQVFEKHIDSLKQHAGEKMLRKMAVLENANVTLLSPNERYVVKENGPVFKDSSSYKITALSPELQGLNGVLLSKEKQTSGGTTIKFKNEKPVKVLVGYFNKPVAAFEKQNEYLKAPELETNASANERGEGEIKIANAIMIQDLPAVNIHAYSFAAGTNELVLGKGVCLILGFINESAPLKTHDAGLNDPSTKNIDWLFE